MRVAIARNRSRPVRRRQIHQTTVAMQSAAAPARSATVTVTFPVIPGATLISDGGANASVIGYVRAKYGEERVCQISTFGSLGAKAALRNVARVLDFPYSQADRIALRLLHIP